MSDFEIGYLMGLFVGEGCFTSYRNHGKDYPVCLMRLHVRDPQPLMALQRLLGGKVYGPYRDGTRITRLWMLRGTALRPVLYFFFQHLPESYKREPFLTWLHKHELFLLYPRRNLSAVEVQNVGG
jgi:hypothetical protein